MQIAKSEYDRLLQEIADLRILLKNTTGGGVVAHDVDRVTTLGTDVFVVGEHGIISMDALVNGNVRMTFEDGDIQEVYHHYVKGIEYS